MILISAHMFVSVFAVIVTVDKFRAHLLDKCISQTLYLKHFEYSEFNNGIDTYNVSISEIQLLHVFLEKYCMFETI